MPVRNDPHPLFDLIALDADDTLWHNETLFHATHERFRALLAPYRDADWIDRHLYETEMRNVRRFGYGIKGFVLSMIETAIALTEGRITGAEVQQILGMGHQMLAAPVELLDGVAETIPALAGRFRLMLLTKGDLFDQETKLARSGLGEHFHAVEIVSEKDTRTYRRVMARHGVRPDRFLMVGNSLRSDVLPVLEAGAAAVYIPYHLVWQHEQVAPEDLRGRAFARLPRLGDLPGWIERQAA